MTRDTGAGNGYQRGVKTFLGVVVVALSACGAPRDPDLERHVLLTRQAKAEAPEDGEPAPDVPVTPAGRPMKTYAGEEIAELIGKVPGAGTELVATITTAQGVMTCTLDERAPQTVANFIGLATGQLEWIENDQQKQSRFYDGLTFHRAVTDFIIQTGNPTGKANAGPGWRIAREAGANEVFLQAGAMGMIEEGDACHGSQFFITAKPDKNLGKNYSGFGLCTPAELVKTISRAEKKANDPKSPAVPLVIESIKIERRNPPPPDVEVQAPVEGDVQPGADVQGTELQAGAEVQPAAEEVKQPGAETTPAPTKAD